jgi:hypothetical protein
VSTRDNPRRTIAPRVARRAVAPRLDRRHAGEPVEVFDSVSGPFERELDAAPRHTHRRR